MGPDVHNENRRRERSDDLPDANLFWRWVGMATRPVVGWVLIGIGAILILAGYFGVSREALVAKQIPYLVSGGIGGMVLVAIGAFFLGTEDIRKDLRRLDHVELMVEELHGALLTRLASDGRSTRTSNGHGAANGRVALPSGRSYHRAACSMVQGKGAESVTSAQIDERGLEPCSLCEPELVSA